MAALLRAVVVAVDHSPAPPQRQGHAMRTCPRRHLEALSTYRPGLSHSLPCLTWAGKSQGTPQAPKGVRGRGRDCLDTLAARAECN